MNAWSYMAIVLSIALFAAIGLALFSADVWPCRDYTVNISRSCDGGPVPAR